MLITMNFSGNIHQTCDCIKRKWYAKYLLQCHYSPDNTIVILKFDDRETYEALWKELGYTPENM